MKKQLTYLGASCAVGFAGNCYAQSAVPELCTRLDSTATGVEDWGYYTNPNGTAPGTITGTNNVEYKWKSGNGSPGQGNNGPGYYREESPGVWVRGSAVTDFAVAEAAMVTCALDITDSEEQGHEAEEYQATRDLDGFDIVDWGQLPLENEGYLCELATYQKPNDNYVQIVKCIRTDVNNEAYNETQNVLDGRPNGFEGEPFSGENPLGYGLYC